MNKSLVLKNKFYFYFSFLFMFFLFIYLLYFLINGDRGILQPNTIDLDYLDETFRKVTGFSGENQTVIIME